MSYTPVLHSIANPHDSATWDKMASIKLNILKRWDTAATGVRTCCIKFVQRVVLVQTPGAIADPRVRDMPTAQKGRKHHADFVNSVQSRMKSH